MRYGVQVRQLGDWLLRLRREVANPVGMALNQQLLGDLGWPATVTLLTTSIYVLQARH